MIEAAIKNAIGKNESGKPKDVIIVTYDRNVVRLFRQIREYLSKTFQSSAFQINRRDNFISLACAKGARIQILSTEHPGVDKNRFEVLGFNGLVYFDHLAIEWFYGHSIENG